MQYRLLALDLDGTLLRSDGRVDDRDKGAIAELQRAGITVTIVTGRLYSGSLAAARACAIAGAIACVEGSHLVDVDSQRTLAHHAFGGDSTELLRTTFSDAGLASFVFDRDAIHHDKSGESYAHYVATWSPNLNLVDAAHAPHVWANEPLAAVAIGEPDAVAAAHAALRGHADRLFSVSFSVGRVPGKHAVLARAAGPSKGTALAELCALAGCTSAEAVAVGDWFNDVPMFEVAGRSFVMADAPDSVRSKASDSLERVAGSGGGVAEAVRRAWG
ncbi:MAG TPA: HAD-IIB family hydrolase [Kofleriaceae bacterium]|nr:HAD-IIB family hydrolase [Kofleriaceae bacterium]